VSSELELTNGKLNTAKPAWIMLLSPGRERKQKLSSPLSMPTKLILPRLGQGSSLVKLGRPCSFGKIKITSRDLTSTQARAQVNLSRQDW
jgi:hypothetical protein